MSPVSVAGQHPPLKIGISISSSFPNTAARLSARHMIERASYAHAANLDSLFVGDHHITPTNYLQNSPILGRLLAHWGDRPVGALFLLPLWHPVLLAEQIGTLAAIAEGPFIMQCGLGGDRRQAAGMGTKLSQRAAMFEASLGLLQALWRGEEVSESRFWQIDRARINPIPPEPVDVWIGAAAPKALQRTARLAQGWLASPSLTPHGASEDLNRYRQACAEHDRQPKAVALRRDIYIGATPADAEKTLRPYLDAGYRGFAKAALVYGNVEQVADQFQQFADLGYTDIIVRNIASDQRQALATIERLADVRKLLGHV